MRDFLAAIWGDPIPGYGEVRCIKGTDVKRAWVGPLDHLSISNLAMLDETGWDCYFGVLPRVRPSGTAADCPAETSVLWADVDAKSHPSKEVAMLRINGFQIPPSILVDSGGGFHCYWLLRAPLDLPTAQRVMRGIADDLHGDRVQDAPRILRIPGTHNHKYTPPPPVKLLHFDSVYRHHSSDFAAWAEEPQVESGPVRAVSEAPLPLPVWLRTLVDEGTPKGTRSEQAFKVCLYMTRYGYAREDIRRVFVEHPFGIGEKYAELGRHGDRWLDRTIDAACEAA